MINSTPIDAAELSPLIRRQGLTVLLANNFLMWTGFIMVIPLLAVHYVDDLGWPAASIGLVLAVRQFTQQGLGVFGGMIADRMGAKGLIAAGLLLRAIGFGMMAWATTFPVLLVSAIFAALGGALFESPGRAATVTLSLPEERARYFALQGTTSSIGTALGPLLGTLLLRYSFEVVALLSGSFYVIAFILTLFWLPKTSVKPSDQNLSSGVQLALRDRFFVIFTLLGAGLWFMWVQFSVAVPLQATALSGTADAVSWLYMLNAAMSITLQYPLVGLLSRWLKPLALLGMGMLLMACGLGGMAFVNSTPLLLGCVALYVSGSLLAMPSQQTASAELANPVALGSYFGVGMLALALGGGVGNFAGGYLYDLGLAHNWPALPWITFFLVGATTATGVLWLNRIHSRRTASRDMIGQESSA